MEHTAAEYRQHMGLPADYTVDGVLAYGTWDLEAEAHQLPVLTAALAASGATYTLQRLAPVSLAHAYELRIEDRCFWFVPVMGTAVLAQYLHVAALLGSKRTILLGIVGGLAPGIRAGDLIIPTFSQGNDNAHYYQRDNTDGRYQPDGALGHVLKAAIPTDFTVWAGPTTTCEMMLAETRDDVAAWSQAGFLGVEMEAALVFAVAHHFSVPATALLYVADNLIEDQTMLSEGYTNAAGHLLRVRHIQYAAGLAALRADLPVGQV